MTVNEIIESLYNSSEVDDCIRRMVREDHRKDFKQELFIKIYDIPAERLLALNERGEIKFYIVRSLINLVKNKSSVYNKNYLRPEYEKIVMDQKTENRMADEQDGVFRSALPTASLSDIDDPEHLNQRAETEQKEMKMLEEINNLDDRFGTHYYRTLVNLVSEAGSMREVSRRTGIPVASISEAVKKVRNHLKKIYDDPETIKGIY